MVTGDRSPLGGGVAVGHDVGLDPAREPAGLGDGVEGETAFVGDRGTSCGAGV
jgi:hypothetical protein